MNQMREKLPAAARKVQASPVRRMAVRAREKKARQPVQPE